MIVETFTSWFYLSQWFQSGHKWLFTYLSINMNH